MNLTGYLHGYEFGATEDGVSFGPYVTSVGLEEFVAQAETTLGRMNSGPKVGPVVGSEVIYHPPDLVRGADHGLDEYVELYNLSANAVGLFDPEQPEHTSRLSQGVDFNFATNQVLGAGAYLLVDRVKYGQSAPWPGAADGGGASLQRVEAQAYGNDPINWRAAFPSPGRAYGGGTIPVITQEPASQTRVAYTDTSFSVAAAGSEPLTFQWRRAGQPILGATAAALLLPQLQPEQAGVYTCLIYNQAGSVESQPAELTILVPAAIDLQQERQDLRLLPRARVFSHPRRATLSHRLQHHRTARSHPRDHHRLPQGPGLSSRRSGPTS